MLSVVVVVVDLGAELDGTPVCIASECTITNSENAKASP